MTRQPAAVHVPPQVCEQPEEVDSELDRMMFVELTELTVSSVLVSPEELSLSNVAVTSEVLCSKLELCADAEPEAAPRGATSRSVAEPQEGAATIATERLAARTRTWTSGAAWEGVRMP